MRVHVSCGAALCSLRYNNTFVHGKVAVEEVGGAKCGHGRVKAQADDGVLLGQVAGHEVGHEIELVDVAGVDEVWFASVVVQSTALIGGRSATVGLRGYIRLYSWPRP